MGTKVGRIESPGSNGSQCSHGQERVRHVLKVGGNYSSNPIFFKPFLIYRLEEYVLSTGIRISNASSSYALLLDNLPSQQVKELDREGHLMLKLSSQLVYSSCITNGIPYNHCAHYISRLDIPSNASVARECSAINRRPKDAPGHPYRRLLPADYSDGLDKLRRTKHNNHPLPSPRSISIKLYEAALEKANEVMESALYSPEGQLDRSRSVFLVQWSQFVEQDLVNTVQRRHGGFK